MKQCNSCANYNCNIIRSGWTTKGPNFRFTHRLSRAELMTSCKSHTELPIFKRTILEHLFTNPTQIAKAFELISSAGLKFVETNRKPGFRLEVH